MAHTKVGDTNLYYETHGEGQPLLLIEGLGYATWMWFKQVPEFSKHFKVITFDNRGVGNSDKPDRPYSIEMMAADAAGVLKNLGLDKAHVLGASMGGMIAQQLAYDYPDLVDKLVVSCSSHGGPNSEPAPPETIKAMTEVEGLSPEDALRQAMAVAFSKSYLEENGEEFTQIIGWRLENPTPQYAWQHQFNAVLNFNSEVWAGKIEQPTLLLTGDDDRVIPPQNSEKLSKIIPDSRLVIVNGAGHLVFIEKAEQFNREVIKFLRS